MGDTNGGRLKWKSKGRAPGDRPSFRLDQETGRRREETQPGAKQIKSPHKITLGSAAAPSRTLLLIVSWSRQPQIRRRAVVARGNTGNYGHK